MKKLCAVFLFCMIAAPRVFADAQDTVVFRAQMRPDNEIPAVAAAGNSAAAAIVVHVTRDDKGNINAATVTLNVDYTITSARTFTGLHIHNAPAGLNGPVVIDSGISGTSTISAVAGQGRITRLVNYASTDTNGLKFVTGLLTTPENYYINVHTTVNPAGFMRAQLQPVRLSLRPVMLPPAGVTLDAEGAALLDIQVNRDPQTAAIVSGTVTFDVDYRFADPATIVGLHIDNGTAGASNASVVIDTGINAASRAITNVSRGNIFRVVRIDGSNTSGLAALTGLMSDPSRFFINLQTTANAAGALQGQLSKNVFVFFNQMTQAEENPPTGVSGTANSMTSIRVDRDSTGNVTGGTVSFNVKYAMGGPVTFTGLHIHNGKIGVNGPVVINTGLSGTNTVVSADGNGVISRDVPITSSDTAFDYLRGVIKKPENYYVNIHTTTFPGGIIRAQLLKETYHFKANMSPSNEVPPITAVNTSATGWITAKISRDATGAINGGTVTFDVDYSNSGGATFTGLHIHYPGVAGVNGPVIINTGIGGANTVQSASGGGNVTRIVNVDSSSATGLATLGALITAPDTAYVNIHTTQFAGGVARSQMFPIANTLPEVVGGGDWTTDITILNPSTTAEVEGVVDLFQDNGSLFPASISAPSIPFVIPPSSFTTISTHNKGAVATGYAKVFSNAPVTIAGIFLNPQFATSVAAATPVTSRSVSLLVSAGGSATQDTAVALIASSAGTLNVSLSNSFGLPVASKTIDVTAGQHMAAFVSQLLPSVPGGVISGRLTITASAGVISVIALQFDTSLSPITVTPLP